MLELKSFIEKNKIIILAASVFILSILFFLFPIIITFDGSHYLHYVSIFNGTLPFSSWDAVRGPVFPFLLYLSSGLFGQSSQGALVFQFLVYLIYAVVCYLLTRELFVKNTTKSNILKYLFLIFLLINPMIFGYFHVLLTEYLAITLTMLNIFLAYKWDSVVKGRQKIFYAIYFVFSVVLAYQLKQPYFILALSPVFISAIISVIKNHKWKNITYRFGTVILSLVFMFASAFAWNKIMEKGNVDLNSGRDSGSLFSTSLTEAVRLEKDGSNTIAGSLGKLFSAFASNPFGIIGEYLKNYCATTSICIIESPDGVRYFISGQIDLLRSFENSVIGYRTFTENDNIFELSEGLKPLAESYDTGDDKGIIAKFFRAGGYVSDILFKFSTFLSPVFLILVLVFTKNFYKKNPNIYNISVICLGTAVIQLLANSFVGLIIDRYSVEIFVPALIGIAGFFILCFYKNTKKSN